MELTTDDRAALQGAMNVLVEILQQASPEVPERIKEWPEDDTHLRGDLWEDTDGDIYRFSDGQWEIWEPGTREWEGVRQRLNNEWAPFTRATDPSIPRTWDSLYDLPENVERVTGDYAGKRREFAWSGLSESGWFERLAAGDFRSWVELPIAETKYVTNIREDQS